MQAPQYGNPIRSGSLKIGGWLPARAGIILIVAAVILLFLCLLKEFIAAGVFTLVVIVYVGLLEIPFGAEDKTLMHRIRRYAAHAQRVESGETLFLASHFGGQDRALGLPGVLSTLTVRDSVDGLGNPVQLLHHTRANQLSVTIECSPAGVAMSTQSRTTEQVSAYAAWLSSLAGETGLNGAQVVVDSVFESSVPLAESILSNLDPAAPQVAQQIAREAAGMLPQTVAHVRSYVTLGYKISALAEDVDGATAEVLSRVPRHLKALASAGSGISQVMSDADYGDMLYTAYNPHRNGEVAQEIKDRIPAFRPFEGAAPEYFNAAHPRVVFHDSVASMTVMMTVPDPAKITDRSYEKLFAPSRHFLRKRVSILYRPVPLAAQRSRIDAASRATTTESTSRKRVTAFEVKKAKAAAEAMDQMSRGAMIQEWALMVTVTFEPNAAAQRAAENELKALMGGMRWCFADYAADAAFHQTLPLGLFPWTYAPSMSLLAKAPAAEKAEDQKQQED